MSLDFEKRIGRVEGFSCLGNLIFPKNLKIAVVGVQDTRSYFSDNKKAIAELISTSDFVAVESDITRLSNYRDQELSGLYDSIFSEAWKQKKRVVCTDPLALTMHLGNINTLSATVGISIEGFSLIGAATSIETKQFTRREVLKLTAGSILALFLLATSPLGDVAEYKLRGCDKATPHPQIHDVASYNEFRNSGSILGFSQLADGVIQNSRGCLFVGAAHLHDLFGYNNDNLVDVDKALSVHKNNIYALLAGSIPSIRVWSPTSTQNQFTLYQDMLRLK